MADRMSLEALRYARAVAETGSFSAAARTYGVTQPALSNVIAGLEEHLAEKLFLRSPRGVTPTEFGQRLLPLIERAVEALDQVEAAAHRWTTPPEDSVRVGVSPLINPALVARTYSALNELSPQGVARQLVLREANLAELREALVAGELDIIVVPSVAPMPRYEHRIIDYEPLVLVEATPGESTAVPAATGGPAGPAQVSELAARQLILMPDTCGLTTFTRDLLTEHELPLRAYPGEAASYRVLEEWSNLGLGSAMLPESKITDPATRYRPMLEEDGSVVEIFYEAVWDPRAPLAAGLQELAERLIRPHS